MKKFRAVVEDRILFRCRTVEVEVPSTDGLKLTKESVFKTPAEFDEAAALGVVLMQITNNEIVKSIKEVPYGTN